MLITFIKPKAFPWDSSRSGRGSDGSDSRRVFCFFVVELVFFSQEKGSQNKTNKKSGEIEKKKQAEWLHTSLLIR